MKDLLILAMSYNYQVQIKYADERGIHEPEFLSKALIAYILIDDSITEVHIILKS